MGERLEQLGDEVVFFVLGSAVVLVFMAVDVMPAVPCRVLSSPGWALGAWPRGDVACRLPLGLVGGRGGFLLRDDLAHRLCGILGIIFIGVGMGRGLCIALRRASSSSSYGVASACSRCPSRVGFSLAPGGGRLEWSTSSCYSVA